MNEREAVSALQDSEVVPCVRASIQDAKRLLNSCLESDIPATLGRSEGCPSGGCSPKIELFVREQDIPRVAQLMQEQWKGLLDDEHTGAAIGHVEEPPEGQEPPCPACGTAAPLVEGACSDCGIQLA